MAKTTTNISDRQVKQPKNVNPLWRNPEEIEAEKKASELIQEKEKAAKPKNKKKIQRDKDGYVMIRKTFLFNELYDEAMRIYTYNERLGLSEFLKQLLDENIPKEVFEEAEMYVAKMENKRREEHPEWYDDEK